MIPDGPSQPKPVESPEIPDLSADGMHFVFDRKKSELLMVIEYAVDPQVLKDKVFQNTLLLHEIAVADEIMPDIAAQKAILESRAFGPGKIKPQGGKADAGGNIEFSIVVADVDTLGRIAETLRKTKGVQGMHLDISFHESDMEMMRELGRVRDDQFAEVKPIETGRAYFVSLRDDVQTTLLSLSSAVAFSPVISKVELGGAGAFNADNNKDDTKMPVAFILRSVPPAK